MGSMFSKEVRRSITGSLGRFIAIVVIVAVGCGFFGGLRMTGVGMRKSLDRFFDGTEFYDLQLVSTLGVSQQMADEVARIDGVTAVMPGRSVDVMATLGDEQSAAKIVTFDAGAAAASQQEGDARVLSGDGGYVNRLVLESGRWPQADDECVMLYEKAHPDRETDEVTVVSGASDLDDTLAVREFKVVGRVTSPAYVSATTLATTTLGSGTINQVLFVREGAFEQDSPYTELFVRVGAADQYVTGTDEYQQAVDEVADRIELEVPELAVARQQQIKDDAQATLDEKRADYEAEKTDALRRLDDAKAELDDALAQLEEGEAKVAENEATLAESRARVDDGWAQWRSGSDEVAAKEQELADGLKQWKRGADELATKKSQLAAQKSQIAEQKSALEANKAQLEQAKAAVDAYDAGAAQVVAGARQLVSALGGDAGTVTDVTSAVAALTAVREQLEAYGQPVPDELSALLSSAEALQTQEAAIAQAREATADYDATMARIEDGLAQISAGEQQVAAGERQLAAAEEQLAASKRTIDDGQAQIVEAKAKLAGTKSTLTEGEAQVADGEAQIARAKQELEDGRAEYENGLATYESERRDALGKLADAERQLDDAQKDIDEVGEPDIYVLDRTQNYGAASYVADSERIDSIATVFPFFFFVVAALVTLTTMTRMVEDDRGLIGTYKALGYSTARITSKYLIYGGVASAAGAALGIVALGQLLPWVIFTAYAIVYNVPARPLPLPLEAPQAIAAAVLGIGVTLVATLAACLSTLRESPAALMQPKAPKAGKRILLEHVGPVWSRLSFSWKVTFRNIFRYKRRFFMTVIGIAGCTMLLVTGFGVRDSINDIIDNQFEELFHYDISVSMADDVTASQLDAVAGYLGSTPGFDGLAETSSQIMLGKQVKADGKTKNVRVQVIVPQDEQDFSSMVTLRTRQGHDPLTLGDDGAVLTEKQAALLGVGVGDTLQLWAQDDAGNPKGEPYEVTITGIAENYVGSYLYLGTGAYQRAFGHEPKVRYLYADVSTADQTAIAEHLHEMDAVDTVVFNTESIASYREMLSSVDLVMVVLILFAAILAFVVLYNLANINISERVREIASLKVLGFTRREVDEYVFREIILIVVIGALAGLVLGYVFEQYVIVTAEMDSVMFGRLIHWPSYLYSFGLTLGFCLLVLLFMRRKLDGVDMVESLKSVE